MNEQIIASIISASAVIIAALIAVWRSQKAKDTLVIENTTEYVPFPVGIPMFPEEAGQKSRFLSIKNLSLFVIAQISIAIFSVSGAWIGSLYWHETGWIAGLFIGLLIGYFLVRKFI